jgi:hypothetical protein
MGFFANLFGKKEKYDITGNINLPDIENKPSWADGLRWPMALV